jgi:hypothetical protein
MNIKTCFKDKTKKELLNAYEEYKEREETCSLKDGHIKNIARKFNEEGHTDSLAMAISIVEKELLKEIAERYYNQNKCDK